MSPYEYSRQHVQERAFQRYGMDITKANYDDLCQLVRDAFDKPNSQQHQVVNVEGQQYTLIVSFKGQTLVAVYDVKRDLVTTLLPRSDFADYLPI